MDDRRDRAGVDDDDTGAGAVLCRHGAQEERARDDGAESRCGRDHLDPLGDVRLFAGVRRRWPLARYARPLVPRRNDDGRRQPCGKDDSGSLVHAVPDDVRDHHGGAGGRLGRRPDAVFSLSSVRDRLVHVRLCAACALGVGRRLPRRHGRAGFCRRSCRASFRRHRRTRCRKSNGPASRLWQRESCAVRPVACRHGHRIVVGRLVRLQWRIRVGRKFARRDGDYGHSSCCVRRRADLGCHRVGNAAQAVGARHDFRGGCGSRHDHAGFRIRRTLAWRHYRHRRGPDVLLGLHLAEAALQL